MKIEETIQEIMKDSPTQKIGLDDFYGRQTVINMLNKAINYNQCSTQLKDKEKILFDKWKNYLYKGKEANTYVVNNEIVKDCDLVFVFKNLMDL
jgi:TPP-dependent 2-oxoacid decarboxylase